MGNVERVDVYKGTPVAGIGFPYLIVTGMIDEPNACGEIFMLARLGFGFNLMFSKNLTLMKIQQRMTCLKVAGEIPEIDYFMAEALKIAKGLFEDAKYAQFDKSHSESLVNETPFVKSESIQTLAELLDYKGFLETAKKIWTKSTALNELMDQLTAVEKFRVSE